MSHLQQDIPNLSSGLRIESTVVVMSVLWCERVSVCERGNARGWFVQENNFRVANQCDCYAESSSHPPRYTRHQHSRSTLKPHLHTHTLSWLDISLKKEMYNLPIQDMSKRAWIHVLERFPLSGRRKGVFRGTWGPSTEYQIADTPPSPYAPNACVFW